MTNARGYTTDAERLAEFEVFLQTAREHRFFAELYLFLRKGKTKPPTIPAEVDARVREHCRRYGLDDSDPRQYEAGKRALFMNDPDLKRRYAES